MSRATVVFPVLRKMQQKLKRMVCNKNRVCMLTSALQLLCAHGRFSNCSVLMEASWVLTKHHGDRVMIDMAECPWIAGQSQV